MPRVFRQAREPFSSYSHFVGAVLSGPQGCSFVLLRLLFGGESNGKLAAAAVVFCLSLIALYSASSVYHFSGRGRDRAAPPEKARPQHDLCAHCGQLSRRSSCATWPRRAAMRSSARSGRSRWRASRSSCCGSTRRVFSARRCLSRCGWAIAVDLNVVLSMPAPALALLAAGGAAYTVGGVIYIVKKPNLGPTLGFHGAIPPVRHRGQRMSLRAGTALCAVNRGKYLSAVLCCGGQVFLSFLRRRLTNL